MKSEKLTQKETEVMELVAQGYSNLQIANMLWNSINTIRQHIWAIYKKLGLSWAKVNEHGALRVKATLIWQELKRNGKVVITNSQKGQNNE